MTKSLAAALSISDADIRGEQPEGVYTYIVPGVALTIPNPNGMSAGKVIERGSTLTVTPELIEFVRDRFGNSWVESIDRDERFQKGEPSEAIRAELEAKAAAESESIRLAKVRRDAVYGRRADAYAQRLADALAEIRPQSSREY
jgi:hypothetical protein